MTILHALVLTASLAAAAAPALAGTETPNADWQFAGNQDSSVIGAPDLQHLGPDTNTFATQTVFGVSRTVLAFPKGNGVLLNPASDVLQPGTYTIEVVFRHDTNSGYRRILDFKNGGVDCGMYLLSGKPRLFCTAAVGPALVPGGTWVRLVVTRHANGVLNVYLDGDLQFSVDDSGAKNGEIASDTLRFFRDNECSGGPCNEDSAGAVSRIRVWDNDIGYGSILAMETCGDANSNGSINAADALLALKMSVGSAWCSNARCDVTVSKSVTAADALLILKASVGSATVPAACFAV